MQSSIGTSCSYDECHDYLKDTLKAGHVIPGYGHAVLRDPDPRFEALINFASSRPDIGKDPLFKLTEKIWSMAPKALKDQGKVTDFLFFPL